MKLHEVQYRNCDICGKSYPLAHATLSRYVRHNNPICAQCIRIKVERLHEHESMSIEDALELDKLKQMLGNRQIGVAT